MSTERLSDQFYKDGRTWRVKRTGYIATADEHQLLDEIAALRNHDTIDCYTRWQELNWQRDSQLEQAMAIGIRSAAIDAVCARTGATAEGIVALLDALANGQRLLGSRAVLVDGGVYTTTGGLLEALRRLARGETT